MKSYDEIAQSVFERRDQYLVEQKRKKAIITNVSLTAFCVLFVAAVALLVIKSPAFDKRKNSGDWFNTFMTEGADGSSSGNSSWYSNWDISSDDTTTSIGENPDLSVSPSSDPRDEIVFVQNALPGVPGSAVSRPVDESSFEVPYWPDEFITFPQLPDVLQTTSTIRPPVSSRPSVSSRPPVNSSPSAAESPDDVSWEAPPSFSAPTWESPEPSDTYSETIYPDSENPASEKVYDFHTTLSTKEFKEWLQSDKALTQDNGHFEYAIQQFQKTGMLIPLFGSPDYVTFFSWPTNDCSGEVLYSYQNLGENYGSMYIQVSQMTADEKKNKSLGIANAFNKLYGITYGKEYTVTDYGYESKRVYSTQNVNLFNSTVQAVVCNDYGSAARRTYFMFIGDLRVSILFDNQGNSFDNVEHILRKLYLNEFKF